MRHQIALKPRGGDEAKNLLHDWLVNQQGFTFHGAYRHVEKGIYVRVSLVDTGSYFRLRELRIEVNEFYDEELKDLQLPQAERRAAYDQFNADLIQFARTIGF